MTATRPFYLQGGRVLDPSTGRDEIADLFVAGGLIAPLPPRPPAEAMLIDATGLIIAPGLIDLHVHLREPGGEEAETIHSGTRAAARGGFTTIVSMPNTTPPIDTPERVRFIREEAERAGFVEVLPSACITRDRAGRALAPLVALAEAGAAAFTDDGSTVQADDLMRAAMAEAAALGRPVMDHAQDRRVEQEGGVMHEGSVSARFGLPGIPSYAESRIIRRDIKQAEETGCRVHIQHVTSREGVELIREAVERGLPVSGEATPHHLALADEDIDPDDADYKMNPPLRTRADREAIRQAAVDGVLAAFATDHAPHARAAKARGFLDAPFGVVGLETAVGVTYTELVRTGRMDVMTWLARWTSSPARVLGRPAPSLAVGRAADLAVLDLERAWRVDPSAFLSRSRNTPFKNRLLYGRARYTLHRGRLTWADDEAPQRGLAR